MLNIAGNLERSAKIYPDKTFINSNSEEFSFLQAYKSSTVPSKLMEKNGLSYKDKVLMLLPNAVDFITAFFAVTGGGMTAVPINYNSARSELEHYIRDSEASAVITIGERHDDVIRVTENIEHCKKFL